MEKINKKINEAPVTRPLKKMLKLITTDKKTGEEHEVKAFTVVDDEDRVVATFAKADYGPRYWFKAHQFAVNNSDTLRRLRVLEQE